MYVVRNGAGVVVGRTTVHRDADFDRKAGPRQLFGLTEFVDDASVLAALLDTAAAGGRTLFGPVGLLPNQTGGAVGLRVALSRPVHSVGRRLGLPALLAAASTVEGTVLVLTGDPDRPVDAGRRLMRTWLTLGRHGIHVHPLSQLLDCPDTATISAINFSGVFFSTFYGGHSTEWGPRVASEARFKNFSLSTAVQH